MSRSSALASILTLPLLLAACDLAGDWVKFIAREPVSATFSPEPVEPNVTTDACGRQLYSPSVYPSQFCPDSTVTVNVGVCASGTLTANLRDYDSGKPLNLDSLGAVVASASAPIQVPQATTMSLELRAPPGFDHLAVEILTERGRIGYPISLASDCPGK